MKNALKVRRLLLMLADAACFACVTAFASALQRQSALQALLLFACLAAARLAFAVYRDVLRYAGTGEYLRLILADFVGGCVFLALRHALFDEWMMFWHAASITAISCLGDIVMRYAYQWIAARHYHWRRDTAHRVRVAIVGAGRVGVLLSSELALEAQAHYQPYCFIDKDPEKVGGRINGIPVFGETDDIVSRLRDMPVQEIVIALPNLSGEQKRALYDRYRQTGCRVRIYDYPFGSENRGKRVLREINVEELLFRNEVALNREKLQPYYAGKTVLVTGGGGSIGSELCRQLAAFGPKRLIVVDIYENNAYEIQQELKRRYGGALDLQVEIASVRDRKKIDELFAQYRPDVVFHAAAHKHVPLMEQSAAEAVKNNVFGTLNAADAAEKYGVKKFILISTDKAVNPTNVMGASKRLCEMIVLSRGGGGTSFAAVRFGNVLGSNGSVVPLFRSQIEAGGPVTLTDKRIVRYFMTIPEASRLVLTAGAMAARGELFVLDMGKPVRILELAERMIRMSGFQPYEDIDIIETGLRPGEKLYEELLIRTEEMDRTENEKIFIERDRPPEREEVARKLAALRAALEAGDDPDSVREALRTAVPTYHSPEEVNRAAEQAEEMRDARTGLSA